MNKELIKFTTDEQGNNLSVEEASIMIRKSLEKYLGDINEKIENSYINIMKDCQSGLDKLEEYDNIATLRAIVNMCKIEKGAIGYVYFLENKLTGNIKIGCSKDVCRRKRQIESQMKSLGINDGIGFVRLVEVPLPLMLSLEKSFHYLFDKYRVFGEWFNISKEELDECWEEMEEALVYPFSDFKDGAVVSTYYPFSFIGVNKEELERSLSIGFGDSDVLDFLKYSKTKERKHRFLGLVLTENMEETDLKYFFKDLMKINLKIIKILNETVAIINKLHLERVGAYSEKKIMNILKDVNTVKNNWGTEHIKKWIESDIEEMRKYGRLLELEESSENESKR